MANLEQESFTPLETIFSEQLDSVAATLAAASNYNAARNEAAEALGEYNHLRGELRLPIILPGAVIAKQLGGRCLFAVNNGSTGKALYWTVSEVDTSPDTIFIGSHISPDLADFSTYSHSLLETSELDEPRIRISGLNVNGEPPKIPYELLVAQSELGSLVLAKLEHIPEEQRFSPTTISRSI